MHRPSLWILMLGLGSLSAASPPCARSQDLPTATPPSAASVSVEQLAERLRVMEEMNRRLADQLERSTKEHQEQMKRLLDKFEGLSGQLNDSKKEGVEPPSPMIDQPGPGQDGVGPAPVDRMKRAIDDPAPEYQTQPIEFDIPSSTELIPPLGGAAGPSLKSRFGTGFQFETQDEEFLLQVHVQSQIEARVWQQPDQTPVSSGFFFPRQRIFFNGRMTKPVEYSFSINRGLGELNILEAYLNFHPTDRFQLRFGRYMTPLTYDQFAIRNIWLPTPERSLFTTNLGLNRQIGLMGWGYLLNKRLDYAAGIFSGPRNSFEDLNYAKDFIGFLNARPFQDSEAMPFARDLNIGASVAYGRQDQPAVPRAFRIGTVAPTNAEAAGLAAAPFLTLNSDVVERGERLLGSVHAAYFYKGLSLFGEWQYGHGGYASRSQPTPVQVPFSGAYLTAAYFLTGEHVAKRAMVQPLRPVTPRKKGDRPGLGAWELVGRVSELGLGEQVFTSGFADPNLWSNRAVTTELGLNWYWNEYLKVYMFWLHGDFDDPVYYRPGGLQKNADMFWLRFQLFF